jgi:hypothetical protein
VLFTGQVRSSSLANAGNSPLTGTRLLIYIHQMTTIPDLLRRERNSEVHRAFLLESPLARAEGGERYLDFPLGRSVLPL